MPSDRRFSSFHFEPFLIPSQCALFLFRFFVYLYFSGKDFGGKLLSFRDSGTYEIAPPPESIWATDVADTDESYESEVDDFFNMDFDEEEEAELMARNPMMPW